MENAIALYGYLILTFLGFIAPILTILLSVFQDGLAKLAEQYSNEISQQEDNINKQLKKLSRSKKKSEKVITQIEKNLRKLKKLKNHAKHKLQYLHPQKQVFQMFALLILSFICILVMQFIPSQYALILWGLIVISIGFFIYTIMKMKSLLNVVVEANKLVSDEKKSWEDQIIRLLQEGSRQQDQFLKKVLLQLNGVTIKDENQEIVIVAEEEQEIKVVIVNSENRMAKQVQVGICFPYDFLLTAQHSYDIYKSENEQILRYAINPIHGKTSQILPSIKLTALAKGNFIVNTFIKAENIRSKYRTVLFIVE